MKNYSPENAHFILPFKFDVNELKRDLEKCMQFDFLQHYVPTSYTGKDYILPLRSIGGKIDMPYATPNNTKGYHDTEVLAQCDYFKEVIDTFKCEKEAVRLMNLPPGAVVNTHIDYHCGYEDGFFRIHIPIVSNEDVHFTLNNETLIMRPGETWYANVNLPHGVKNGGKTNRVHMVIDGIRNDWSDEIFKSVGYDFSKENIEEKYSDDTTNKMIAELERQDTPGAKALLKKLKLGKEVE